MEIEGLSESDLSFETPEHRLRECPVCKGRGFRVTYTRASKDERYNEEVPAWAALYCLMCGRWLAQIDEGDGEWRKLSLRLSDGTMLRDW